MKKNIPSGLSDVELARHHLAAFLRTVQAARYLGLSDASVLRRSRITGELLGYPAPPYRRLGKAACYYAVADLDAFMAQIPVHSSRIHEPDAPAARFVRA